MFDSSFSGVLSGSMLIFAGCFPSTPKNDLEFSIVNPGGKLPCCYGRDGFTNMHPKRDPAKRGHMLQPLWKSYGDFFMLEVGTSCWVLQPRKFFQLEKEQPPENTHIENSMGFWKIIPFPFKMVPFSGDIHSFSEGVL